MIRVLGSAEQPAYILKEFGEAWEAQQLCKELDDEDIRRQIAELVAVAAAVLQCCATCHSQSHSV